MMTIETEPQTRTRIHAAAGRLRAYLGDGNLGLNSRLPPEPTRSHQSGVSRRLLSRAPAELEALLLTHPAVMDAAVIPSPDEEAGEVPKAFVVKKGEVSDSEIMAFVAEKVAPHKRIRLLEFTEQIPKSASGKILRRVLIDQERAKEAAG